MYVVKDKLNVPLIWDASPARYLIGPMKGNLLIYPIKIVEFDEQKGYKIQTAASSKWLKNAVKSIRYPTANELSFFSWDFAKIDFLKDTDIITFGIHKGKRLIDVPADYLLWYYKTAYSNTRYWKHPLSVYIHENLKQLQYEAGNSTPNIRVAGNL